MPERLLEELGAPPAKPRELATWASRLMASVTWLEMRGEIGRTLSERLRADVGAITRTLPRAAFRDLGDDEDEEDDVEGPELEDVDEDAAPGDVLRIDP